MYSDLSFQEEAALPAPTTLRQLTLTAFRNHADLRLDLSPVPVVLTGPNGSGKTNILEAVSLLVPGRGFRRAALNALQSRQESQAWAVAASLDSPSGNLHIGTGRDPAADPEGTDRRLVQIDGALVKSQQDLARHVVMTWITPDMDRVLSEGPGARRRLLDRLVYSFDPAHAGRVQRYEKAARERLYLLREGNSEAPWLKALEDTMAQAGVAIAAARLQLLEQLQASMAETRGAFPQAWMRIDGLAEQLLENLPALLVEDRLRAEWAASRRTDAESGATAIGPHRSDLCLTHQEKNCPADYCSTGEQKALLISLMMAYVRVLTEARHTAPLFLMDDITSHLDAPRREALFTEIRELGVQAWLTGTDPFAFTPFLKGAQHFSVHSGGVASA